MALNIAYQVDAIGVPFEEALETAKENARAEPESVDYAEMLISGFREHRESIDAVISRLSEGWTIERQPAVDRNILRLAMFEISHTEGVPAVVVVNEAVELAKKYSTADSGKFVNGVLAAYLREIKQEPIVIEQEADSE